MHQDSDGSVMPCSGKATGMMAIRETG
eukprot:SAG22_NODE_7299_length_754_cov_1.006107_1_plen_26_part_10